MSTVSEAQLQLANALENHVVPEDFSDWDAEDWTVFALNYLMANLDEVLESISPQEEKDDN